MQKIKKKLCKKFAKLQNLLYLCDDMPQTLLAATAHLLTGTKISHGLFKNNNRRSRGDDFFFCFLQNRRRRVG